MREGKRFAMDGFLYECKKAMPGRRFMVKCIGRYVDPKEVKSEPESDGPATAGQEDDDQH